MATCCQYYCLGLSAFSTFFLLYLCVMIAFQSQTIYLQVHNSAASAVALFIAAVIYAGITGYNYYNIYVNVDRKQELRRWIQERRVLNQTELSPIKRGEGNRRQSDSRL